MVGVIPMEEQHNDILRLISIGLLLPVLFLCAASLIGRSANKEPDDRHSHTQPSTEQTQQMQLTVLFGSEKQSMALDDYLLGVVLGEMPAGFEMDALRAQAVAARTYTLKQCTDGRRHGLNTICTDHSCCQAYIDKTDYVVGGGSEEAVRRVRQAIEDTNAEVLTYGGELIYATYFSCAGDATEPALAVWGEDVPYLQSVPSPGEENAVYYTDSKTFSAEEFQNALGVRLEGTVDSWFGQVTYTAGGGVDTLSICGIPYRGTTLRTLLQLRSTDFTVTVQNGQIRFRTKGYGHRVGLSQYGANAMAKMGKNYMEILTYYYTGAEIVQYSDEMIGF